MRGLRLTPALLAPLIGGGVGILVGSLLSPTLEPHVNLWLQGLRPAPSWDSGVSLVYLRGTSADPVGVSLRRATVAALESLKDAAPKALVLDVLLTEDGADPALNARARRALKALSKPLVAPLALAIRHGELSNFEASEFLTQPYPLGASLPMVESSTALSHLRLQRGLIGQSEPQGEGLHSGLPQDGLQGAVLAEDAIAGALYSSEALGFANLIPFSEPVYRQRPWVVTSLLSNKETQFHLLPSLALAAAAKVKCGTVEGCLEAGPEGGLWLGGDPLPLDEDGALPLSYRRRFAPEALNFAVRASDAEWMCDQLVGRELELLYFQLPKGEERGSILTPSGCRISPERLAGRALILADGRERPAFEFPSFLGVDALPASFHAQVLTQLIRKDHLNIPPPWVTWALTLSLPALALALGYRRRGWGPTLDEGSPLVVPLFLLRLTAGSPEALFLVLLLGSAAGGMVFFDTLVPVITPTFALAGGLCGSIAAIPLQLLQRARSQRRELAERYEAEQALLREAEGLKDELAAMELERDQSRERIEEREAEIVEVRAEVGNLAEEKTRELEAAHRDWAEAHAQAEALEERLTEERARRGEEQETFEAALENARAQMAARKSALVSLEADHKAMEAKASTRLNALEGQLEEERRQAIAKGQALERLASEIEAMTERLELMEGGSEESEDVDSEAAHGAEPASPGHSETEREILSLVDLQLHRLERIASDAMARRLELGRMRAKLEGAEVSRTRLGGVKLSQSARRLNVDTVDKAFQERCFEVERFFAPSRYSIIVLGETGTGKDRFAKGIHRCSPRRKGPLVIRNCSQLNSDIAQSDLFGHVKGAFTGANIDREGAFREAHGGTLILDEIHQLLLPMQAQLLRALETGEVRPAGSDRVHHVDVRIIAVGQPEIEVAIKEGRFREDLYARLTCQVRLPPLRQRDPRDIELLARRHYEEACQAQGKEAGALTKGAVAALQEYAWPLNVRQLANVMTIVSLKHRGGNVIEQTVRDILKAQGTGGGKLGIEKPEIRSRIELSPEDQTFLELLRTHRFHYTETAKDSACPHKGANTSRLGRVLIARALGAYDWDVSKGSQALGGEDPSCREAVYRKARSFIKKLRKRSDDEGDDGQGSLLLAIDKDYDTHSVHVRRLLQAIEEGKIIDGP